ncbi:MAG: DNA cytosine methyltransferase, partial [Phycisphaeraceae bacterium JB051]
MKVYYNEIDQQAAAWLRELIKEGHLPAGDVDERSIEDVKPTDVMGYDQCHFFAGIGGWPLALRLAEWPDDCPVWTGSCPCQSFSSAGKGDGFNDKRHLWPHFYWLIQQCMPATILGEQVASKAAESWVDLVQADLEALDYPFGCVPFPAASVGAPEMRDRNYWMACMHCHRLNQARPHITASWGDGACRDCATSKLEDTLGDRCRGERSSRATKERRQSRSKQNWQLSNGSKGRGASSSMEHASSARSQEQLREREQSQGFAETSLSGRVADHIRYGRARRLPRGKDSQREVVDGQTGSSSTVSGTGPVN